MNEISAGWDTHPVVGHCDVCDRTASPFNDMLSVHVSANTIYLCPEHATELMRLMNRMLRQRTDSLPLLVRDLLEYTDYFDFPSRKSVRAVFQDEIGHLVTETRAREAWNFCFDNQFVTRQAKLSPAGQDYLAQHR